MGTTDSALAEPTNSLPDGPEVIEPGLHSLGLDFLTQVGRDEPIRGVWAPEPWMENGRGTVQGGVVLAVVGEIAESVGDRFVRPGQRASLMDVDVSILGAPTTDSNYDVACRVIRAGRRIGVMEIEIVYGERHLIYASAQVLIS
ncbi:PaaI family thioesterase [Rhodococcus sp. NPDC060086]|uniref:PaaI family thioesterase n=1 Tax=Rhodococcus sp. NPDC060086 TaxID=3347055 RepID=UPI00365E2030